MEIWVAVGAVIRHDNEILLVKHVPEKQGFWSGEWICPGGGLEPGETLEEGAKREVREETDIEVELGEQIPAFSRILHEEDGYEDGLHVLYIDFHASPANDGFEVEAGSDAFVAKWFGIDELDSLEDLHVDTRRLLEKAGYL